MTMFGRRSQQDAAMRKYLSGLDDLREVGLTEQRAADGRANPDLASLYEAQAGQAMLELARGRHAAALDAGPGDRVAAPDEKSGTVTVLFGKPSAGKTSAALPFGPGAQIVYDVEARSGESSLLPF